MRCEELFKKIDEIKDEYTQFLIDICNIESPSNHKPGVDEVGNYIAEKALEQGWQVERQKQEVSGDCLCITMNPQGEGKPICFSAHMDTVHPIGLFGNPPVKREGEKLIGPGLVDCKGGIAASFLAMRAMQELGFEKRPIKLILQSDEEVGSSFSNKTTVDFMAEKAKDCVAFLNTEGYTPDCATVGRKGIRKYILEVTGKSVHGALCYNGASAILEAAQKIMELEKYKDPKGITCNCGTITGGTVTNAVPHQCIFSLDVRFATQEQMKEFDAVVKEIAAKSFVPGTECKVSLKSYRVPMEMKEENLMLLKKMNEIYAENGLPQLKETFSNGGSDAADISSRGIPTIDSIGVYGGRIHSAEEFVYISSIADCAKRIAAVAFCI